ncbi:OLC1v1003786C1 [Oldenlandia corymbosa var. corymbosa]|uniref:Carboxypeptidase n=1 Tax=Oldenlandia corymbosa var. corymbosa TaxID=529605 RepID=A0AAV1DAT1_OLDCO|nr:OLC1v1003786C1 [Oldenlandia corymbosa var. corymbosa]
MLYIYIIPMRSSQRVHFRQKTMAKSYFPLIIISIILLLNPPPSIFSARIINHQKGLVDFTPKSRESPAKKLIRELNLFPQHDANIVPNNHQSVLVDSETGITEKCLELDILGDPQPTPNDLGHHAGYFSLPQTVGARMFYFFFESRGNNNTDPVVIWLTGGPGCGSELALFYENGPFHITKDLSLVWNNFGWDTVSNIIYVDQPTGTGFSYSSSDDDLRHDEKGVSNDLYNFLQAFFKLHPEYAKNDFYITGESYAGHYIPALAGRINQGNQKKEGITINLKGFAIGNGLTNPAIQYEYLTQFALDNKLISQSDYKGFNSSVAELEQAIQACDSDGGDNCDNAFYLGNDLFQSILDIAGDINYYDIRKKCVGSLCYDFSNLETFLNEDTVKEALGVGNIDYVSCSSTVYDQMIDDWMQNLEVGIPALLEEGVKVLIYAGEYDLICNWLGNSKWVNAMVWSGQKDFVAAPTVQFSVNGTAAGQQKSHGPLTFLKVLNAGHLVPMDQPQASLVMLQKWMQGTL